MTDTPKEKSGEIKDFLRQLAAPVIDSLDTKLREQIDERVEERVNEVLSTRLAVLERAIADLDRAVRDLQAKKSE